MGVDVLTPAELGGSSADEWSHFSLLSVSFFRQLLKFGLGLLLFIFGRIYELLQLIFGRVVSKHGHMSGLYVRLTSPAVPAARL